MAHSAWILRMSNMHGLAAGAVLELVLARPHVGRRHRWLRVDSHSLSATRAPPTSRRTDGLEPAAGICGVGSFEEPPLVFVGLESGDQLVIYTDGLIESLTPRLDDHQLRLR